MLPIEEIVSIITNGRRNEYNEKHGYTVEWESPSDPVVIRLCQARFRHSDLHRIRLTIRAKGFAADVRFMN